MRKILAPAILLACLEALGQVKPRTDKQVVLPNTKLLRCTQPDCYRLWQGDIPAAGEIYPEQIRIELGDIACPFGVMARYSKSVAFEDLRSALEKLYGKGEYKQWTEAPMIVWHVESEKLTIQLETADRRMAKAQKIELGTNSIHYTISQAPVRCER